MSINTGKYKKKRGLFSDRDLQHGIFGRSSGCLRWILEQMANLKCIGCRAYNPLIY